MGKVKVYRNIVKAKKRRRVNSAGRGCLVGGWECTRSSIPRKLPSALSRPHLTCISLPLIAIKRTPKRCLTVFSSSPGKTCTGKPLREQRRPTKFPSGGSSPFIPSSTLVSNWTHSGIYRLHGKVRKSSQ